jgi:hypothetical protein
MSQRSSLEKARDAQAEMLEFTRMLKPLTPQEVVSRALHLVNDVPGYELTSEEIEEGEFALVGSHGFSDVAMKSLLTKLRDRKSSMAWWKKTKPQRDVFRTQLDLCIADSANARVQLRGEIVAGLKNVVPISELVWTGERLDSRLFLFPLNSSDEPSSIKAWCAYVLALVLDADAKIGDALRACKLCTRMFLSFPPAGGGPRPSYCRPEHRLAAAQLTGSERTERWRQKQAKARKAK